MRISRKLTSAVTTAGVLLSSAVAFAGSRRQSTGATGNHQAVEGGEAQAAEPGSSVAVEESATVPAPPTPTEGAQGVPEGEPESAAPVEAQVAQLSALWDEVSACPLGKQVLANRYAVRRAELTETGSARVVDEVAVIPEVDFGDQSLVLRVDIRF